MTTQETIRLDCDEILDQEKNRFRPPSLSSGGIVLTYQCTNRCRHCLYASSPTRTEWMSETDLTTIYREIKAHDRFLTGLHLGGGEPFLNPDFLEMAVWKAGEMGLPLDYVETNAFWSTGGGRTERLLRRLYAAGLRRLLVSVSPFHLEYVPIGRIRKAVEFARRIFGPRGVIVYTESYYLHFSSLEDDALVPFDDYLRAVGEEQVAFEMAGGYGLIPNGRAAVTLVSLFARRPAHSYFGETCFRELGSPHHVHVDPEGNVITGLCAGLALGDGRDLGGLYAGVDLSARPLLALLLQGGVETLFRWAKSETGYREDPQGYIAKCHLCLDIRRHLAREGFCFPELAPLGFYQTLDDETRPEKELYL